MANIYQVIEDLSYGAMRDLLQDRIGYLLPDDTDERILRNTIIADYEFGLLTSLDIREMAEGGV